MLNVEKLEKLKENRFIVIGTEHYNPLGVARSLKKYGITPDLIVKRDSIFTAKIASACKHFEKIHVVKSFENIGHFLMAEYGKEKKKAFVYSVDDVATGLLDCDYDLLKDHFYIQNCGGAYRIDHYMKKEVLNELAAKHGIRIAKTWDINNNELPDNIVYPVITKPLMSYDGWKKDYYICNNEKELRVALDKVNGEVFLQQYIDKENEICIDGFAINHGNENFISIASTYTYLLPDYYSFEMVVSNFNDNELEYRISKILKDIGYEGIYCIEFLIDKKGNKWFLEINFRNSGWSWASTCVGMNLPVLWAYSVLDGNIPKDIYKAVPDGFIALDEVGDYDRRVRKYKLITFREWYAGVKRANCLYYYDKHDKLPSFSVWTRTIVKIIISPLLRVAKKNK